MPYYMNPYDWDSDSGNLSYGRIEPDYVLPYGQGYCNVEPLLEENFLGKVLTKLDKNEKVDFSFWFDPKTDKIKHAIRVKICWDIARFNEKTSCSLALHGEYKYKHSPKAPRVSKKRVDNAIEFFKCRKVLFAAVWEGCLEIGDLYAYLCKDLSLKRLLRRFNFKDIYEGKRLIKTGTSRRIELIHEFEQSKQDKPLVNMIESAKLKYLERAVRKCKSFNMND
mgnify:FL=1